MSNSSKFTWKDALSLLAVFSVIGLMIWGASYLEDQSARKNCEARHRTVACLTRMIEEVKAKEAYEQQIKELNK